MHSLAFGLLLSSCYISYYLIRSCHGLSHCIPGKVSMDEMRPEDILFVSPRRLAVKPSEVETFCSALFCSVLRSIKAN